LQREKIVLRKKYKEVERGRLQGTLLVRGMVFFQLRNLDRREWETQIDMIPPAAWVIDITYSFMYSFYSSIRVIGAPLPP